ncbi:hypothetical protein [Candidatus Pantoea multigeneris]|uniref:EcsC protein family protein n=1 Tax=Candidatus Pantoea multigeneris TaxID=2608357 RepID=A0ABX0RDR0_9GAMM|nr:hypothetical protein [Pantoea multigeneris]NIF23187.1 hypothetical protein [Pantoea multigeneris]
MSSHIEIATRIVRVLLSPDTAVGIMGGILSVPKDLAYMAYGFMDTDSRSFRQDERIRMTHAIRFGILQNSHLKKSIETTLDVFSQFVPGSNKDKLAGQVTGSMIGRFLTNTVLTTSLLNAVVFKSGMLLKFGVGTLGNLLLINGMAERSIYTSMRLKKYNPELWQALRAKNYDFLYFLIEPAVQPFTEALHVRRTQGLPAFEKILDLVEEKLNEAQIE